MRYDETNMAAVYDRGRSLAPAVLDRWMDVVARRADGRPVTTVLDLGCGTGRCSGALARRFGADVVGVDPSVTMLVRARAKGDADRVRLVVAAAEAIPLATGSVDVVFMSMVYHHLADRLAAGADSILAAVNPRELEAGLAAIRARAAGAHAGPVTEPIDVLAFRAPTGHAAGDSRG